MEYLKDQYYPSWSEGDRIILISIEKFLKSSCRNILNAYEGRTTVPAMIPLLERRTIIKEITEETCHTCIHRLSNGFSECRNLNNDYEGRRK